MSRPEFVCKFNDSILTDEESERQQDRQDVSMGAMSLVEYRMKWYNEDEATAKSKVVDETDSTEPTGGIIHDDTGRERQPCDPGGETLL